MRRLIKIFLALFAIALLAYSGFVIAWRPFHQGAYLGALQGAALLVYAAFIGKFRRAAKTRAVKAALALWKWELVLFFASFLAVFIAIQVAANAKTTGREDAIIVLGAGLNGDSVSATLKLRLDAAADYFLENGGEALIVVSGGQGRGETVSEAAAMSNYLIGRGIPRDKLLIEDKSASTRENFRFSKVLLDEYFGRGYTCVFVTNDFHTLRAGLYAKKEGLTAVPLAARSYPPLLPADYLREYLAILAYFVSSVR